MNSINTVCGTNRIQKFDWADISEKLDASGNAVLHAILSPSECQSLVAMYPDDLHFRSRVVMARHGYGKGEYKYLNYPLPGLVQELRTQLYEKIAPIANRWNTSLRMNVQYPDSHADYLQKCHDAGQTRPTPLILKYEEGDYNCLHQDLYGEHVFPIQIAFLLSRPDADFTGGEFVLTEQHPRMQSRVEVVPLSQGDAVIFTVNKRPVTGTRGVYGVNMRHGVSQLRGGNRFTMGIIFHDAK